MIRTGLFIIWTGLIYFSIKLILIHASTLQRNTMSSIELKGQILVYSIVGCPHCKRAKQTLRELGLPFAEVSLDSYDESVRESVRERTGKRTVPQVFFNAVHIGGNEELQALVRLRRKSRNIGFE